MAGAPARSREQQLKQSFRMVSSQVHRAQNTKQNDTVNQGQDMYVSKRGPTPNLSCTTHNEQPPITCGWCEGRYRQLKLLRKGQQGHCLSMSPVPVPPETIIRVSCYVETAT